MCKKSFISNNKLLMKILGLKNLMEEKEIYQIGLQLWIFKKKMTIKIMD